MIPCCYGLSNFGQVCVCMYVYVYKSLLLWLETGKMMVFRCWIPFACRLAIVGVFVAIFLFSDKCMRCYLSFHVLLLLFSTSFGFVSSFAIWLSVEQKFLFHSFSLHFELFSFGIVVYSVPYIYIYIIEFSWRSDTFIETNTNIVPIFRPVAVLFKFAMCICLH